MIQDGVLLNFKMSVKKVIFYFNQPQKLKRMGLIASALIPFLIFSIYFASNNFNLLTVDLGQQYIDLLAFLRQNLFSDPSQLIYSFQNGLGGSMIGTDAYYLCSPFNFILFLFPKSQIPLAIDLIIASKIATIGLASFYYWYCFKKNRLLFSLAASWAYSLSAYTIANYFNLMWLDSLIFLPLLILAIDQTIANKKNHLILITFVLWITNFYTGIMALFFGFLYLICRIFVIQAAKKEILKQYFFKSILATCLAAFLLIPTLFELLANKGTDSSWSFSWQFSPIQEISKFADGSYNFHEMEAGMPNIFFTTPFLLGAIGFFTLKIPLKQKIASGCLLLFLLLSLVFTPLILIWHLGQFPTWYPGRFSFVLIFYCLNLSLDFLQKAQILSLTTKVFLGLLTISIILTWYANLKTTSFLKEENLLISCLFAAASLLFYFFIFNQHRFDQAFLTILVLTQVSANLILSFNNLSFQNNYDYQNFTQNIQQATNYLQKSDHHLFRLQKTFSRSDDDPFSGNYNGLSSFNSMTNKRVLALQNNLGFLHNSNSFIENGGTQMTDAILGVKYLIIPNYARQAGNHEMLFDNDTNRLDLKNYQIKRQFSQVKLLDNVNVMPLAFISPNNKSKIKFTENAPLRNQEALLQNMLARKGSFYEAVQWPKAKFNKMKQISPRNFIRKNNFPQSSVSYNLKLSPNYSYYLELPSEYSSNQLTISVNNRQLNLNLRDPQNYLVNLAGNTSLDKKAVIQFTSQQKNLNLSNFYLFRIKSTYLNQVMHEFVKKQPILKQDGLIISSNRFNTHASERLLTTIPYSQNWFLFDQGKLLKKKIYAQTFLQAKLDPGQHQLILIYLPLSLILGILISILGLLYFIKFCH